MTGSRWSRRVELGAYFGLAVAFSWAVQVPLALSARGLLDAAPPMWWHYLGSFGPLLAAGVVTAASRGGAGCRELFGRVLRWRVEPGYYLFAAAPVGVFVVIVLVMWLLSGQLPDVASLGEVDYLGSPGALTVLVLWLVTFGLGEEVGWRGFALPRLQATRSALAASLLLGPFWAAWHLPALFYRDTYLAIVERRS